MTRYWDANSELTYADGSNIVSISDNLGYAQLPIGAILAWAKTLAGAPSLPTGFVQCDGQTLSDADSPLNGQVMPALNAANRMLKGATTSGATGGQATHTHTIALTTGGSSSTINGSIAGAGDDVESSGGHTHNATQTSTAETATPPYYEVVWIIRVK